MSELIKQAYKSSSKTCPFCGHSFLQAYNTRRHLLKKICIQIQEATARITGHGSQKPSASQGMNIFEKNKAAQTKIASNGIQ
jgi:hypothetical protein